MTTRNFIFISLVILPFMARGQQNKNDSRKVVVQDVQLEDIVEDDIEPPPPHLVSKFKSIQDWLINICDKDKPQKTIATYKFGLFESPNDYTLVLVGINTYDEKNRSVTRIEFEPTNMYFRLPKTYFQNLNREQLLDKLTSQLKDFANTEKFKTSFLAKANAVIFETNGKAIWTRQ